MRVLKNSWGLIVHAFQVLYSGGSHQFPDPTSPGNSFASFHGLCRLKIETSRM